jgi:hypothetical protein
LSFFDTDSRATPRGIARLDVPFIKQFLQLNLQFYHLLSRHRIWLLIDRGSTRRQLNLEFEGTIRKHPLQFIKKHIQIFTYHRYLIQVLGNISIDRCLETSDRWQLQRNHAIDRRVKVNEMSRDGQHHSMHLHPVHNKNDINSLTFKDDKSGGKHSLSKLKRDFMDYLVGNHSASRSANGIRDWCSTWVELGLSNTS